MKRVLNESATKRCHNCRRPKGEHKRVQGIVLCPRRLNKFHPHTTISAITYCHCDGKQITIQEQIDGVTAATTAEVLEDISDMISEGSPICQS